jgi:hypothetical protein
VPTGPRVLSLKDHAFADRDFAGAFLTGDVLAMAGFFAAFAFAAGVAAFLAGAFATGFLGAGFAGVALLRLYNLVPATAAAAVAKTAPATAADFPGLSLIAAPADVAASLAELATLFAVSAADFAADFALPVRLSAKSRSFSLALSKVPVFFGDLGMGDTSSKLVDRGKSPNGRFVPCAI